MSRPGHDRTHRGLTTHPPLPALLALAFVLSLPLTAFAQVTRLVDDFNGAALDTSKWSVSVFTGLQDISIPVNQINGQLQIGPLLQGNAASGSHYNGITSMNRFDFTGAYASVQLVQPAAPNTTAFTIFAVG